MTDDDDIRREALEHLKWPLRLTRAGMAAERIVFGFWPVWTILFAVTAALGFGLQDSLPLEALWIGSVLSLAGLVGFLARGIWRFRWPTIGEALARLDGTIPGRPIHALTDAQAVGRTDAASAVVWRAHLSRMAARLRGVRSVNPDLRVSSRDPFALRYAALAAFVMAVLFGSLWRVSDVATIAAGGTPAQASTGPSWEAWIEPPAYTGKPSLYLNEIEQAALDVPAGSVLTVRLYGAPGDLDLSEDVSDPSAAEEPEAAAAPGTVAATPDAAPQLTTGTRAVEAEIVRSGTIEISGDGGRSFKINVLSDTAPTVVYAGDIKRDGEGAMSQPFTASDDYGVTAGRATIRLDIAKLDRSYGLAAEPEAREDLVFDLPMPITGKRDTFTETLAEDASKHPWANMPVTMTLGVEDARGQTGASEAREMVLPGRRFFDPLANAVIEMRRDILWTRENGPRVLQVLRAFTHRPEGFITNERAYLMLRVAMRRLDAGIAQGPLSPELRDEIAEAFWEVAILLEDGGLSDALARMQRAQERLSEAIRRGASPEEIQRLMDELAAATDNYIRELAENMERQGADEPDRQAQNGEGQQITGDQIQQMMDEIQRLMEEGRMAEAQELLEQFNRMMQNLQVTEGDGQGEGGPGRQAMRDLQDTLRNQQGLSDETFRDLQRQFGQGPGEGEVDPNAPPGQNGRRPGDPRANPQEGQGGQNSQDEGSLADRQQALRDALRQQEQQSFPGADGPEGEAARRAIEEAGRAMDEAEEALRNGDNAGALDRQAEAIENLREGLRGMADALAQNNPQGQQGAQPDDLASNDREVPRDPLGRVTGQNGRIGTDEQLLQGEDVYRRARDLLDELRRRVGEQTRPEEERDYLKRLLDLF